MNKISPNFDKTMFGFFMSEVWFPAKVSVALDIKNLNPILVEATMTAEAAKENGIFSALANANRCEGRFSSYLLEAR